MGRGCTSSEASQLPLVAMSANLVLKRLERQDKAVLETGAELVKVRRGTVLIQAGDVLDSLYFPETTLLAIEDGEENDPELAVIGREGFVCWSLLLGARKAQHSVAVTTRDGSVLRVRWDSLQCALSRNPTLIFSLLPFVEALTVQMGRSILSNARDALGVRVARWLLMRHDRVGGDELLICHDKIAFSLGIRRASVTDVLHIIEGDGLIRCRRGRIVIRNRKGLETMAAESYGRPEACYRLLMGPFGKRGTGVTEPVH